MKVAAAAPPYAPPLAPRVALERGVLQQLLGYASGGEITVELADQALELIDTA